MGAAAGKQQAPRKGKTWCHPVQHTSIKSELAETKIIPSKATVTPKCASKPAVRANKVVLASNNSRPKRSNCDLIYPHMSSQEKNTMNTTRSLCKQSLPERKREHERPPLSSSGSAGSFCRTTIQDSRQASKKRFEDIPISGMWRDKCGMDFTHKEAFSPGCNTKKDTISQKRKPIDLDESILKDIDEIESNYMAGQKAMQTRPRSYNNRVMALSMEAKTASSDQHIIDTASSEGMKGPPARRASDTGGINSGCTGTASSTQPTSGISRRPATPAEPTWLKPRHLYDYFEQRRLGECNDRSNAPTSSNGEDRLWMQTIPDREEASGSRLNQPPPRRRARKDAEFPSFFTF